MSAEFPAPAGGKVHPLSLEQQTIYAVGSVSPELVLDELQNLYVMVRLRGPVDPRVMQAAFDDVVARHSALRTRPALSPEGEIVQEEFAGASAPVQVIEERGGVDAGLIERLAGTRISYRDPPFARVSLSRLGEDDCLLFLGVQHLACDVTGLYIALADLARAYQARAGGGRLEPLAMGYGDYARWQAEHFAGRLEGDAAGWERYLAELEPYEVRQDLPFQPGMPGMVGRSIKVPILESGEFDELQRFVTRHRATTFVALLAALHLTLGSRTHSSGDRLSATYFDQRDHPATKEMVGYFLRPTLVRSRLPAGQSIGEALGPMTRMALEAHRRAHVPLLQVIAAYPAALSALMGQSAPWYFLLHYMPQPEPVELRFGEARGTLIHSGVNSRQEPGFAMALRRDVEGRLAARLPYDPGQWREESMRALAGDFARALREMMRDPARKVSELAAPLGSW